MSAPTQEHDELIARLADLYVDEYWAECHLRVASQILDPMEHVNDVRRLVKAGHEYRSVTERIEEMKKGVDIEVLYGDALVVGHALRLAVEIRESSRKHRALVGEQAVAS